MSAADEFAGPEVVVDAETQKRKAIIAIMMDTTLTEAEKSRKRQELMMGSWVAKTQDAEGSKGVEDKANGGANGDVVASAAAPALDENLKCAICMDLCERPVTAPCQHNFCLACFKKWTNQGKKTCPTCRAGFPTRFSQNPRINTALIVAIRLAKNPVKVAGPAKEYKRVDNEQRPDAAFTTDRAQRNGRANAASGRIMVTIPNDHFGTIEPEHDPERNLGVKVGEWWHDRLDCRQWGAHFPHVAGIAGQSETGAQSVVLSGGYEDDRDEGEWFLYTGSGGRDLSGNKRTNKEQSSDQEFTKMNKALQLSCLKGLPVRVVRSYKEKRSAYAPTEDTPVRYDGIYRILRCWRKPGMQGPLVCRYLFRRCDNCPAPWSSAVVGDRECLEVPAEAQKELDEAQGKVFSMQEGPYWDWLAADGKWGWAKPAPASNRLPGGAKRTAADPTKRAKARASEHEKALREFKCQLCKGTLNQPIRTPCGHDFCKACLEKRFPGGDVLAASGSRSLRVRKVVKPCPCCQTDVCDFLATAQVNREMSEIISKLQGAVQACKEEASRLAAEAAAAGSAGEGSAGPDEEPEEEEKEGSGSDEVAEEQAGEEEEGGGAGGSSKAGSASNKQPRGTKRARNGKQNNAAGAGQAASHSEEEEEQEEDASGEEETAAAPNGKQPRAKRSSQAAGPKRARVAEQAAASQAQSEQPPAVDKDATPASTSAAAAAPANPSSNPSHVQEQGSEEQAAAEDVGAVQGAAGCCLVAIAPPEGTAASKAGAATTAGPAFKYQVELSAILSEFPDTDEALAKCLLEDQAGDLKDVRFQLRKLKQEVKRPRAAAAKAAAPAADDATDAGAGGQAAKKPRKGRAGAAKRRGGRKAKAVEESEGEEEEGQQEEQAGPLAAPPAVAAAEMVAA